MSKYGPNKLKFWPGLYFYEFYQIPKDFWKQFKNWIIIINASLTHPWISKKRRRITDPSTHHWFPSTHLRRIPEFLKKTHHRPITDASTIFTDSSPRIPEFMKKKVGVSPTYHHQLITGLSSTHHQPITDVSSIFCKKLRRITDPSSTHHWPIINSLPTYP